MPNDWDSWRPSKLNLYEGDGEGDGEGGGPGDSSGDYGGDYGGSYGGSYGGDYGGSYGDSFGQGAQDGISGGFGPEGGGWDTASTGGPTGFDDTGVGTPLWPGRVGWWLSGRL